MRLPPSRKYPCIPIQTALSVLELTPSFFVVPANGQDSTEFSDAIDEAIAVLVEFSLLTRITREMEDDEGEEEEEEDPANDLLTIHRLVQKVVYDTMDGKQRLFWAYRLATAFARGTQGFMDTYLSHIRYFASLLDDLSQKPLISEDLSKLLDRAIWYLLRHGAYFGIEELVQFYIRVSEATYGSDHPGTATSLNKLAILYNKQGKYDEAEPLYQRTLVIFEKALGAERPDTAQGPSYKILQMTVIMAVRYPCFCARSTKAEYSLYGYYPSRTCTLSP